MYFQCRGLPSASHLIDVVNRSLRVPSRFASVTHSRYSRCLLGANPSKVFRAFAFFFSAAAKSGGTAIGSRFFGLVLPGTLIPASFNSAAFLT